MLPAIGLGLGLIGSIGKMFGRGKANREMNRLLASQPEYKENPLARQRLALTQALSNARMPGALAAERNIYTNQANQISNINRAATDSSQALALAAGTQVGTNRAFTDLGMAESQDQQRRLQNLFSAQEGVINEQDKVYKDQVNRWQNTAQIRGTQNANRQANWGDLGNLGFSLSDFGMAGGFNNLFGNNRRKTVTPTANTTYYNGYSQNSDYGDFVNPFE